MHPVCLRIARGTASGEKDAARTGYLRGFRFWGATTWRRLPYDVVTEQRVMKLRPSCLKGYAAGMGRRSEGMGHSNRRIERSKRRTHSGLCGNIPLGRPLGEPGSIPLVHPGSGKGPPGFYGKETLEKPDNNLSITPHCPVGNTFWASPPKVFTLVRQKFHETLTTP